MSLTSPSRATATNQCAKKCSNSLQTVEVEGVARASIVCHSDQPLCKKNVQTVLEQSNITNPRPRAAIAPPNNPSLHRPTPTPPHPTTTHSPPSHGAGVSEESEPPNRGHGAAPSGQSVVKQYLNSLWGGHRAHQHRGPRRGAHCSNNVQTVFEQSMLRPPVHVDIANHGAAPTLKKQMPY